MKKFLLVYIAISFFLILFIVTTIPTTFAAQRCKSDSECTPGDVCIVPNPNECAAIGNKDPAACYKYCLQELGSPCKTNADCPGVLVCQLADPNACATIGGKDPGACRKICQNPPATPTPTQGPVLCGQPCNGISGPGTDCPDGTHCVGAVPAKFIFGTCEPDPGQKCQTASTSPSTSPPPPPPSPPCASWGPKGACMQFATAFGNFLTNPSGFVKTILSILLSASGAIALLLIFKAGYQMMTSQGKPEQLQQGRDQLIAAIVGLIFLIFSFVMLQTIGFDILQIPGFGP